MAPTRTGCPVGVYRRAVPVEPVGERLRQHLLRGRRRRPAHRVGRRGSSASLDARDFITVDKPPGALWVTGLSVRLFGMNSWSVLAPQAVMGVAAVAVLFATVRRTIPDRRQGTVAGLLAGAVLACTPAAALMFRYNNPDAFLVLLLVVAAYCLDPRRVMPRRGGGWRSSAR